MKDEGYMAIYMELLSSGSLKDLINEVGGIEENYLRTLCKEILKGIEYLHLNRIVHLDIKADNILMDGRQKCKITDFGTAGMLMKDRQSNRRTWAYRKNVYTYRHKNKQA